MKKESKRIDLHLNCYYFEARPAHISRLATLAGENIMPKPKKCLTIFEITDDERLEFDFEVSYEDVVKFSEVSGDWNPVHHDKEYASTTIFKDRIAHGMISLAKLSGVLGTHLPGLGAIYFQQSVEFHAPVYLDRTYVLVLEVLERDQENNVLAVSTGVESKDGDEVMSGVAVLKPIPKKVKDKMGDELLGRLLD